ncbi:MAG: hypothetical protein LBB80_01560 [Treponema sp.]|nr:hypothetical protein [Treponema sp.]
MKLSKAVVLVAFISIMLLTVVQNTFAYDLGSNGNYSIRSDGDGNFWIDDNARGICVMIVQATPTSISGTYEFLCGSTTRRRVSSATGLASIIAGASGGGWPAAKAYGLQT